MWHRRRTRPGVSSPASVVRSMQLSARSSQAAWCAFLTERRVPIVAITAYDDRQRCIDAGMDGYLAKPYRPQDLFETVERMAAEAAGRTALGQ